jgi:hypothetical protein
MADLAVLAIGFGGLPLAAIALVSFREWIATHPAIMWGGVAGVVAFLGLAHAMAFVLQSEPFLVGSTSEVGSIALLTVGLALGGGLGWAIFRAPFLRAEPSRVVVATAAFLALHSAGDGLILGRDFVGAIAPAVRIDAITVSATVVHRLVEGALVLVPAIAATWRPRSAFLALSLSLVAIPAAYVPGALADALGLVGGSNATRALSTLLAAMEALFALVVLVRGLLPMAATGRGSQSIVWIAVGFIGISVVHFLVE